MLDLDLFRIGNFRWGNVAMLVFGFAFSSMFFGSILFLTNVWEWSILEAGLGIAPGPALVALLAPRMGKLAGVIGQRPIIAVGGLFYAAGGLWRVVLLGPDVNYWFDYFPSMVLTGAALQAVRQFGGTFGVAITVALLASPGEVSPL